MNVTLTPGPLAGTLSIPASKSQAHRLLICAALGKAPMTLSLSGLNEDITATIRCLNALGANIVETQERLHVDPISAVPQGLCHLDCGESGSTLRFLLPVVGALGARAVFHRAGRLPQRPLAPLDAELCRHGMELTQDGDLLCCSGQLLAGHYTLPGNVSSQYISGLLLALPRLGTGSTLTVTGPVESAGYISMTLDALDAAGIAIRQEGARFTIPGRQTFALPPAHRVEGDWSSAAAFLCAGALSAQGVTVEGLNSASLQADRDILPLLARFGALVTERETAVTVRAGTLHGISIDAAQIPDLVPVLAALACFAEGKTTIYGAARLRLKESDRLTATAAVLGGLGAAVEETADGLSIEGKAALSGGLADPCHDHRIAMAAALASLRCTGPITVTDSECVNKSYPRFWDDLKSLKGGSL